MNLNEYEIALKALVAGWTVPAPAIPIVLDNEANDTNDNTTKGAPEFIRITTIYGDGFVDEVTGIYDVRGNSTLNAFLIQFDVFTKINTGTARALELCQSITDYWNVRDMGDGTTLDVATPERIGEDSPYYHMAVTVSGRREEHLIKR